MHRGKGSGASSGPEVTNLDRAVSLNDGNSEGYTGTQKKGDDSELHIEWIERYLICYEIWILKESFTVREHLIYTSLDGLKYTHLTETLQHT